MEGGGREKKEGFIARYKPIGDNTGLLNDRSTSVNRLNDVRSNKKKKKNWLYL